MGKKHRDPDSTQGDENIVVEQNIQSVEGENIAQGFNNNSEKNANTTSESTAGQGTSNANNTTTGSTTGKSTSNDSTTPQGKTLNERFNNMSTLVDRVNAFQNNIASLNVGGDDERIFYDRKIKPLLDEMFFLSQSAQSMAIASQNMQSIAFAKKKQIKLPVDLSYEIVKEIYCMFEILKKRNSIYRRIIEDDLERCNMPFDNCYESSFLDLDEECFKDMKNYYNNFYCDED